MSSGLSFASNSVWPVIMFTAVIMGGLLVGNTLKRYIPFLRKSLIPVSVIGGIFLLFISSVLKFTTGEYLFNWAIFCEGSSMSGIEMLEVMTYHCLAIGFIAMTLRKSDSKGKTKGRVGEVVNTGITTVSTYLLQGFFGLAITVVASFFIPKLIKASGLILCFGIDILGLVGHLSCSVLDFLLEGDFSVAVQISGIDGFLVDVFFHG